MLDMHIKAQRGATLIEVLVTLVVLSVGLLGMAGLQALSLKNNHSAYYRSQATFLAYDVSERMRANREVANNGGYAVDFPDSSNANSVSGSLAERDKAQWLNLLADTLPGGTGKISHSGGLVTVEIRWDDSRGAIRAADDETQTLETFVYRTEI